MSHLEKLLHKLINPSTILTFKELEYILKQLGYIEQKSGKTSGSRRAYFHPEKNHVFRIHKPHPGNELKKYAKLFLLNELKRQDLI